ncbi:MAG: PD-(D/E)XK nuclease family protein [Xanthomonadales bacterium]|nr:PD-(D/E)XK nuclease family protein [Xanthomonadales bacterium]
MSVQELLRDVSRRLDVVQEAENRFSRQLAPRFNAFHYLRNDEYGLSWCLSDLLDPNGTHGQGDLFLSSFIELLPKRDAFSASNLTGIRLEHPTDSDRRIDILLRFSTGWVGIENKPWADDQEDQLKDYSEYLGRSCRGNESWALVFFSNRDPTANSIDSELREQLETTDNFVQFDFRSIEHWLRACACEVQSIRVRLFVEELSDYIRQNLGEALDMTDEREVISVIEQSDDFVRAASDVARSWDAMKLELACDFRKRLKDAFEKHPYLDYSEEDWKPISKGSTHCGFYVLANKFPKDMRLSFQFDNAQFRNFFIGVDKVDEPTAQGMGGSEAIFQTLKKRFNSGGKTVYSSWWCWADEHELLGEGFRNWNTSSEPWVAIRNGRLADRFVEISEAIYCELGDKFDIPL